MNIIILHEILKSPQIRYFGKLATHVLRSMVSIHIKEIDFNSDIIENTQVYADCDIIIILCTLPSYKEKYIFVK